MITCLHIPSAPLNRFIDYFYYYAGYQPEHSIDRMLPDGNVQLIFNLTDHPQYIYDNETLKEIQSCRRIWFSGFRTEPISIPSGKESEMVIVFFKKGKAAPFIREPMINLTNTVVDAELVMDSVLLDVRDQLQEIAEPSQKLAYLETHLLNRYLHQLRENPFVDFAIQRILDMPNQSSIRTISAKAGYSQKHIIKMFKDEVGTTPKEFLKIIRFQQVIRQIDYQIDVNWTAIADDCGFYDQSHFIADFKTFSCLTPAAYLKMRGEFLNYIPVG